MLNCNREPEVGNLFGKLTAFIMHAHKHWPSCSEAHLPYRNVYLLSLGCKVKDARNNTVHNSLILEAMKGLQAKEIRVFYSIKIIGHCPVMKMDGL